MAIWSPSSILLRVFLILALTTAALHAAGEIGVRWGQHGSNEGSIEDVCKTGAYKYLYIDVLDHFGNFQTPKLNISHCDPQHAGCTYLGNEIKQYCQEKGIKVLLSIGGNSTETYTLASVDDAMHLATFLWDNFLGGSSISRPFGDAVLDGIDFDIRGGTSLHWDDLAAFLKAHSEPEKEVYLSATPQCEFPDPWLEKALDTSFFDYVSPRFYGSPACNISQQWSKWTTIPAPKLFLGLITDPPYAIATQVVCDEILPVVMLSDKFAGITLWGNTFYETLENATAVQPCMSRASPFLVSSLM